MTFLSFVDLILHWAQSKHCHPCDQFCVFITGYGDGAYLGAMGNGYGEFIVSAIMFTLR